MDEQDWYFTFGANHTHPDTGLSLGDSYVVIHGTCDSTRDDMLAAFGNRWSMQYSSKEQARIDRYGLREVEMPAAPVAPVEPPPVEERTGEAQLVDELREEYAQGEADQDRRPTDVGFIEWLARRAARVAEDIEAPDGAPQRATNRLGEAMWLHPCGRVAVPAPGSFVLTCDTCGRVTGWRALYVLAEERTGVDEAQRAEVLARLASLRSGIDELVGDGPEAWSLSNAVAGIEQFVRGEVR